MEIANVFTVECAEEMEDADFRIREAQIGPRLGAELIGGSVYEIDPGKKLLPYDLHHANEEWPVVSFDYAPALARRRQTAPES